MNYRQIQPEKIQVASSYQRAIQSTCVSKIVKNYDPEAFGVLVVGQRSDGSLWAVDGQTRLTAALRLKLKKVPCLVFESQGKHHEASVFRLVNMQRNVSRIDKLHALVCEGDPNSLELLGIVRRHGFDIGFRGEKSWPFIRSVTPLEKAYDAGNLDRVLSIVNSAWGPSEDATALQATIIGGLCRFIADFGQLVADADLAAKLSSIAPSTLVGRCEAAKMIGGSREMGMRDVLIQVWNKGKRNKLTVRDAENMRAV